MSGTHVSVSASAAHTSFVHVAPQRSHGDVPDGRIAKDRSTGSHCGGHVTASPIAREDASSIGSRSRLPHVKENTSSNTPRAFSWNLPSSCSRVAGHFHMWEHDYLLGNSCRGNSLRSRGGAVAAFSRLSTTRLPEAAATQRRSSCRLQHIGRYPRGSGARTVVARLPLARLRVGPGEGRLAAPLLAASRAPGAPTRFWRRALKVPLASPVGPGEVLRAHPRGTTPPASPSPQRQPVSVRPCFDPGQDSHIIQRSENHQ